MRSEKVSVRELLAPLIISQANLATGSGTGVDLSYVYWLLFSRKKKPKKKPDIGKILRILWSLKMLGKLDSLRGDFQLG